MNTREPSQTAERVALTRAIESLLPENKRICWDPYAQYFLKGKLARVYRVWLLRKMFCMLSERYFPGVMAAVLLRTRFIDEFLVDSVSHGTQQIVNFGAGYDTRPFRFQSTLKDVPFFELDHPATQKRKAAVLKSAIGSIPNNLHLIPMVFDKENLKDHLMSAGYHSDLRTIFIWEGVTYYISPKAVDHILKFVSTFSGPESSIIFDFFPPSVAEGTSTLREARSMSIRFEKFGEALNFGLFSEEMPEFLSIRGFKENTVFSVNQLKNRYLAEKNRHRRVSGIFFIAQAGM